MTLTNSFKEAVATGNVRRVRIMMKDSMLNDPTFFEFDAMNNAARDLLGLYDKHDGRNLNKDKNIWNDSYMNELMVQIVCNFSHERVDHLKEVVSQLRPAEINSQRVRSNGSSFSDSEKTRDQTSTYHSVYQKQENHNQQNGSYRGAKIAGGAIVGAVAGGTIAALVSVSFIGGFAIGAVAGAVTVTVATNGE